MASAISVRLGVAQRDGDDLRIGRTGVGFRLLPVVVESCPRRYYLWYYGGGRGGRSGRRRRRSPLRPPRPRPRSERADRGLLRLSMKPRWQV